jgi:hypothetical protein
MSATPFWNDRFTMLMACASPGSAFAYHLGLATFESGMLRRDKTTETPAESDGAAAPGPNEGLDQLITSGRVVALP